ncbi:MAG: hypothetical protein WC752_00700 [Patescibacteria group bacterium]|jgi:hypothetical protein
MKAKSMGLIAFALVLTLATTGAGCSLFGEKSTNANANKNATKNTNAVTVNKNVNKVTTNTNKTTNTNSTVNSNTNTATEETSITTDSISYAAGDDITVTYDIKETIKDGAWIGIVPTETAHGSEEDGDAADVDWQYLNGSTSGTMTFSAPTEPGDYDIRAYDSELDGGIELGYDTFAVEE